MIDADGNILNSQLSDDVARESDAVLSEMMRQKAVREEFEKRLQVTYLTVRSIY